jgi:ABC-2 type transport system permease protein
VVAWLVDGLGQAVSVLDPVRPLSPFYQALGRNPLRDGVPWTGWAILVAATAVLVVIAAAGLERRDVRQ